MLAAAKRLLDQAKGQGFTFEQVFDWAGWR